MENEKEINYIQLEEEMPSLIKEVKAILQEKHGLTVPDHCDQFVVRCLRIKDGNVEKAVKLIKAFHSMVVIELDDWDTTILPSAHEKRYNTGALTPMIKRDPRGRQCFLFRAEKWNTKDTSFDDLMFGAWMIAQHINAEYIDIQRHGYVTVWDCSKFSLQHAWAVKHWKLMTMMKYIQNSLAGRMKAFHFINFPRIVGILYLGVKPFLKEKLKNRIIFHNSIESLHEAIGREDLPKYLGGDLEEDEAIDKGLLRDLVAKDDYFKDMLKYGFPAK